MNKACLFLSCLFAFSTGVPLAASATERADIVAGLNTLPLLTTKITGDTTMAVLYDPAISASVEDAKNIKKIVDSGMKLSDGAPSPRCW